MLKEENNMTKNDIKPTSSGKYDHSSFKKKRQQDYIDIKYIIDTSFHKKSDKKVKSKTHKESDKKLNKESDKKSDKKLNKESDKKSDKKLDKKLDKKSDKK